MDTTKTYESSYITHPELISNHFQKLIPEARLKEKMNCEVITIIGNIGSGKTTLTALLAEYMRSVQSKPNVLALFEPVEEWKRSGILKMFYNDIHTMAFPMQVYAFSSRLKCLKIAISEHAPTTIVMDGSIYTDKMVFKAALMDAGHISQNQDSIYNKTFENWEQLVPEHKPKVLIYIQTSPEICFKRKNVRAREEEVKMELEYLKKLHDKFESAYETFIKDRIRVLKVDGNLNPLEVLESVKHALFGE